MTQATRTGCGCQRGTHLCSEAVRLWNYVTAAYSEALETGKWFPYNDFRQRYEEHFQTPTQCTADGCTHTFNYVAERANPTLCLAHSAEQDRADNGWSPENSID